MTATPSAPGLSRPGFLLRLTGRHWMLFLADMITGTVFFLCALVPGLALRQFLNELPERASGWVVPVVPLVLFMVFKILNAIGAAGWMAVDSVFRFRIYDDIRMRLTAALLRRPGALPPPVQTGDLLSRYRDDAVDVAEMLGKRGIQLITSSVALSGTTLAVLFSISVDITVLAVLPTLLIAVVAFLASKKIKSLQGQTRQTAGNVSGFLREVFAGVETIKVTNASHRVVARMREVNDQRRHAAVLNTAVGEVLAASQNVVIILGTALVMLVAADHMRAGTFRVGDFAYFIYALGTMGTLVDALGRFVSRYQRFQITCQRLSEVLPEGKLHLLTTEPGPIPALHRTTDGKSVPGLVVDRLSYDHPNGTVGVRDVTFTASPGDLVLITGPVGSGKTTLLRAILGLLPRTNGRVSIDNHHAEPGTVFRPPLASYTPQNPNMVSDTLAENVLLGCPYGKLQTALVRSTLDRDLAQLERGVDTLIGPSGHKLSGGQLHRLAAARMFARPAAVLLIDDLSASLDVETEHQLLARLIHDRDSTLVVVSNRPGIRRHATTIITMNQGRAVIEKPDGGSA